MSIVHIDNIGTFTYNYKINSDKKINIIASALFRTSPEKNIEQYTVNLLNYSKIKQIKDQKFVFRLYYDNSILNDEYIKKIYPILNKNCQLVHYDCPLFKNEHGLHDGTFGSLMRFLPFHDFPENDVDKCFICDVDDTVSICEKRLIILLEIQNKYKVDLVYLFWIFFDLPYVVNDNDRILANFLTRQKIPIKFLIHYINVTINELFEKFDQLKKIIDNPHKKYRHKFFYGVDELYLELYVKVFIDKQKIKYARHISYWLIGLYPLLLSIFKCEIKMRDINLKNVVDSVNKKFKTSYTGLYNFILFFKNYDWYRKTNMYKQYEYFHKKVLKLYNKNPSLKQPKHYNKFKKMSKFIDDTNNIEIFN